MIKQRLPRLRSNLALFNTHPSPLMTFTGMRKLKSMFKHPFGLFILKK